MRLGGGGSAAERWCDDVVKSIRKALADVAFTDVDGLHLTV